MTPDREADPLHAAPYTRLRYWQERAEEAEVERDAARTAILGLREHGDPWRALAEIETALGVLGGGDTTPPAEHEHERIEWADVREGDLIEMGVFTLREGNIREHRSVLAVDWPHVTLTGDPDDPERVYTIDAAMPERVDRRLTLIARRSTPTDAERPSPDSDPPGGVVGEAGPQ